MMDLAVSVISKCLVQFLLVQMGKLRPREGKRLAQSHRQIGNKLWN